MPSVCMCVFDLILSSFCLLPLLLTDRRSLSFSDQMQFLKCAKRNLFRSEFLFMYAFKITENVSNLSRYLTVNTINTILLIFINFSCRRNVRCFATNDLVKLAISRIVCGKSMHKKMQVAIKVKKVFKSIAHKNFKSRYLRYNIYTSEFSFHEFQLLL